MVRQGDFNFSLRCRKLRLKFLVGMYVKVEDKWLRFYHCTMLPHVHLLLWLKENLRTNQTDDTINAEIPDANADRQLHGIIVRNMIYHPCGSYNPLPPCMKDGKSTKRRNTTTWTTFCTGVQPSMTEAEQLLSEFVEAARNSRWQLGSAVLSSITKNTRYTYKSRCLQLIVTDKVYWGDQAIFNIQQKTQTPAPWMKYKHLEQVVI